MASWKEIDDAIREVLAWRWEMSEIWADTNGDYYSSAYQFAQKKWDQSCHRYNTLIHES